VRGKARDVLMRKDLQGHSPYGELVGTTIVSADEDARTIEVGYEAKHEFTNRIGTISGGMLSAMLDSVTGLAALVALPEDLTAAHTSLKVQYLRPANPGRLTGRARVVEYADRDIRSEGELLDAEGTTVARGEATLRVLRKKRA
jgi:uncharacterized protein (TIGR00369 family)